MVLSSNFERNLRGELRPGRVRPADEGIAIYFTLRGRPLVMARDRYHRAEGNMRSLALALEAMRQLERHGGATMMDRAFAGFAALPPPAGSRPWHELLELPAGSPRTREAIEAAYKRLARRHHPDQGGSADAMAAVNLARDEGLREIGA